MMLKGRTLDRVTTCKDTEIESLSNTIGSVKLESVMFRRDILEGLVTGSMMIGADVVGSAMFGSVELWSWEAWVLDA